MPPSASKEGYYEDGHYTMHNYRDFADVFDFDLSGCYNRKQVGEIEGYRKRFQGLFVDKVLKLVGVEKPRSIYPPKTKGELRALHGEIVKAGGIADHLKLSLLFYILLDCSAAQVEKGRGLLEDRIAQKFYLPGSYELFMKGLWYMDRGDFNTALQYLTHPSLVPTLEDEILETLVQFSSPDDLSLALAYYHTVQPSLKSSKAVESLFEAIAAASVTQAFYFSRSQPENVHKQLFEALIAEVFQDEKGSERTADRSVELVNLPFTSDEEQWFEVFLTSGEGKSLRRAADTLMMRKIGSGRFEEALGVRGIDDSQTVDGMSWQIIAGTMKDGLGARVSK